MNFKRARVISGHSTGDTPPPCLPVVAVAAARCTLGSRCGLGVMLELQADGALLLLLQLQSLQESRNAVTMVFQITGCGFI